MHRRPRLSRLRLLVALGAAALTGCANSVTDALIEQPLGKLSELGVSLQFRMDDDPLLETYVRQIGAEQRKLVRRTNVPYRWSLVDLDAPNAFAIPYGGIYVTRGLLRFADTEDEIAFVMGHEMGHVERRHSSLAFQRSLILQIGLALVTSNNNEDWMQYAHLGNYFLDLAFSRQNEHAADRNGVMYSWMGGWDPYAGAVFFGKLDDEYGRTPRFWSYLETHPINRDRINVMVAQPYLSGSDPSMICRVADGYMARGLLRSAEKHYRETLVADAQYADAHLGLARIHGQRGELALARASYHDALRYGADQATIDAEVGLLPAGEAPREDTLILASAREAADAREQVARLEQISARVAAAAAPLAASPLDTAQALVAGNKAAGGQLDALYGVSGQLLHSQQQAIIEAQKVRANALRAAAEMGAIQEEAEATSTLLTQNRERLLRRLDEQPTLAATKAARDLLTDTNKTSRELLDGVGRLNELLPEVSRAVERNHQSIAELHSVLGRGVHRPSVLSGEGLLAAQENLRGVMRRTVAGSRAVYTGRARALQSSIDITMLDRAPFERVVAQRVIARFTLADPGELAPLLEDGFSYGEAAYMLAMAQSGETPGSELAKLVRQEERDTVERLDARGFGRTGSAAIMLKLIDNTLKDELDAAYGTRLGGAAAMPVRLAPLPPEVIDEADEHDHAEGPPAGEAKPPRRTAPSDFRRPRR